MLAPFSKYPKIVFNNVKVGTSKQQHIIVRNPNDSRVEVCQYRLYETSCKCIFDLTKKPYIFVMPVTYTEESNDLFWFVWHVTFIH